MRIAIITQDERLYLPIAIERLLQKLGDQVVAGVILPSFNEGRVANLRRFLGLMGPVDLGRLLVRYAAAAALDRVNRFVPLSRPWSAQESFQRHRVAVHRCPNVNDERFHEAVLRPLELDLVVSIAASQIFKAALLHLPKYGCINLHSSPLPKYRGLMPNFWAMACGERETCVSVHRMDEKIDTGNLILQKPVKIPSSDSLHALMSRSKEVGADALLEAIARIAAGDLKTVPLDMKAGSYHRFPTANDAKRLRDLGHRFF